MQNCSMYDYTITIYELGKLIAEGKETIIVIINGEYYEVVTQRKERK